MTSLYVSAGIPAGTSSSASASTSPNKVDLSPAECMLLCGFFHGCSEGDHSFSARPFGDEGHLFINVFHQGKIRVSLNWSRQTITDKTQSDKRPQALSLTSEGNQVIRLLTKRLAATLSTCCMCRQPILQSSGEQWVRDCALNDKARSPLDLLFCTTCHDQWRPLIDELGEHTQDVLWVPTKRAFVHLPHSRWKTKPRAKSRVLRTSGQPQPRAALATSSSSSSSSSLLNSRHPTHVSSGASLKRTDQQNGSELVDEEALRILQTVD
jgi:hypothetical protein